jgi:hypothetical protein
LKVELPYFKIGNSLGGQQDWFPEYMMRIGGCGAVTACDCSIYFELYKNLRGLYPFDVKNISQADYIKFSDVMKPYLHPRWQGINKLEIYIDGFTKFLRDRGEKNLQLLGWDGHQDFKATHMVLKYQMDNGYPIPCLTLRHKNPLLEDYVWHWFLITGYEILNGSWKVKLVSYGVGRWFDFDLLWDTGFNERGGLIIFQQLT